MRHMVFAMNGVLVSCVHTKKWSVHCLVNGQNEKAPDE